MIQALSAMESKYSSDSGPIRAPKEFGPDNPRQALAILAGFGFLILAIAASIAASVASADANRLAAHALHVRQALGHLFSLVQDAETGQRGFLLTGDETYLQPFAHAQHDIPAIFTQQSNAS
jgi:CHASE3 domain sensor protein